MIQKLKIWLSRPNSRQYGELLLRLTNVESAIESMISSPVYEDREEFGFNGQNFRKKIFSSLMRECRFQALVETGTWIGNTTGYLANQTQLPIHTCEINPRFHALAKSRLKGLTNICFELMDSPSFLKKLSGSNLTQEKVFFYLDAHWYDNLPLKSEIETIGRSWKNFVIMIDDFEVPNDPDYRYDDFYGKKNSLTANNFLPFFISEGLTPFFPAVTGNHETGSRRGCVVLVPQGEMLKSLEKISELVRFSAASPA